MDKKARENVESLCNSKQDGQSLTYPIPVKAPHLRLRMMFTTFLNKFSRLFREMKNGKDNAEVLFLILDDLRKSGTLDEESCQTVLTL